MNKRGYAIFFAFMMGIVFFLLGMALAPALKDVTTEARNDSQLDCSNISISDQNKAICTQIDIFQPLYVGVIMGLAGLILGGIALR